MPTTMKLIAKQSLGSAASTIDFTSIPGTYTDLHLVMSIRGTRSDIVELVRLRFNGATSDTNHSCRVLFGNGGGTSSTTISDCRIGAVPAGTAIANTFSSSEAYLPNYAGSTNKSYSATNMRPNNSSSFDIEATAGLWSSTAAITSISVQAILSTFAANTSAFLYGITKA
jgi:hypothetical protein